MKKVLFWTLIILFDVVLTLAILIYLFTYHPNELDEMKVICKEDPQLVSEGSVLTILNWNVQFLAGKKYVFFFDVPDNNGPHERPEREEIEKTLAEVVRIIKETKPDVILFQELDEGAKRTDYEDQLKLIWDKLPEYKCASSAFYWKNTFVPHPRVMGSTGLKLSTLSKFQITKAYRHALPIISSDIISEQFALKRAILETRLPTQNGKEISVMNTHLDAFAQGTDTMMKQVIIVKNLLNKRNEEKIPWIIGGDFNLLPPKFPLKTVYPTHRQYYNPQTEISILFDSFQSAIPLEWMLGEQQKKYYTHIANDPDVKGEADRILDYVFYSSDWQVLQAEVIQKDTSHISDHFPILAKFKFEK